MRSAALLPPQCPPSAEQALYALRALSDVGEPAAICPVLARFARLLGARQYVFAVIDRREADAGACWQCTDACGRRPLALLGAASTMAAASADHPAHHHWLPWPAAGRGDDALVLKVEAQRPGPRVACMGLVFDGACGVPAFAAPGGAPLSLPSLAAHGASLAFDAYLRCRPRRAARLPVRLSAREAECIRWAAAGKTSAETAQILDVCERTVTFHLRNVFAKLEVNNKQAAIAQAILGGLI